MLAYGDYEYVSFHTGEGGQRVAGNGESRLVREIRKALGSMEAEEFAREQGRIAIESGRRANEARNIWLD